MLESTSTEEPTCLSNLQRLLSKVKNTVQSRIQSNQLSQYRLDFQITQPKYLVNGILQQHQMEALEWMVNLASQDSNGILADDMGLGKTIQAISYLAYLKEQNGILGKHLVLCPKSVCNNWVRQIHKWFPSANVQLLLNTQKEREQALDKIIKPRKFDILVTTYDGAKNCFVPLSRIKWEVLIVDEAHKIKNSKSENFQILSRYRASFKLLMTGTPLSNNLRQLWSLLNFIMPDIFDDCYLFDQIENSVQQYKGTEEEKLAYQCKVANFFHQIIGPFFKRRTKKDLELGLPPKIQKTLFVPLSELQLKLYRNFLKFGNVLGPNEYTNYNIMNPRKICLHPYLFEGVQDQDLPNLGQHLVESCGKLKIMDKLLHKLIGEGHKVLIFSQFTMLLDLLEDYCQLRGYKFCRVDGSTEIEQRQKQMDLFNNTNIYSIFLLSTRAGGLGINLVSADRVIIYDIDWNPQNDLQAMDRAYRIGQTKAVHVYKLVTEHSIEERILELQKYKLIWDELVIQKGAFVGRSRSNQNPFSQINLKHLASLGKGEIFRLQANEQDKTIEQILAIGDLKDQKKSQQIRKKLVQDLQNRGVVINPFQNIKEEITKQQQQFNSDLVLRRNYDNQKRQKTKFERTHHLPPFKFYLQSQKIRELQFELYMETKRPNPDFKVIDCIEKEIKQAKAKGKFDNWNEIEFNSFVQAHKITSKNNYEQIAQHIGTKNAQEVKEYSQHYFEKAPNNQRLLQSLRKIELWQAKLRSQKSAKGQADTSSQEVANILKKGHQSEIDETYEADCQQKNVNSDKDSQLSSKTITKQQHQKSKLKKQKSLKKKEEDQRLAQQKLKQKQQARIKRQEQLRLKQQLKKQREQERLKKAEEKQKNIEEKKKLKQIREEGWRAKREQREQQQKLRKQKRQQEQAKKAAREEAERLQKQKQKQNLQQIKRQFQIKKAQMQKNKLKQKQQQLIKDMETDIVKTRSQRSSSTNKIGSQDPRNSDHRQTKSKLEIVKAKVKDKRFND